MDRRRFLRMLSLAPAVVPVVCAAAPVPDAIILTWNGSVWVSKLTAGAVNAHALLIDNIVVTGHLTA